MICLAMYIIQNSLLYRPSKIHNLQNFPLAKNWRRVNTLTQDGLIITSWYLPAKKGFKTILYLHGNAGDIVNRKTFSMQLHQQGYGIFLLSYRGFANNPGKPSEQGLLFDSQSAYQWLVSNNILPEQIILFGESLGAANAIKLASKNTVFAVILESPFYSMLAMGQFLYPWLPVNYLLKDKYLSYRWAQQVKQPVLIFYGLKDEIIPYQQVRDLQLAFPQGKNYLVLMPEQTHNRKSGDEMATIIRLFEQSYF
tara:strand:- start:2540 stop:3298 length:759 start_codon:yes stop_codon:yes gene_type:complete